jgi:murein DD-endopeptidase MepM/ murein hydrolase activator NlpD
VWHAEDARKLERQYVSRRRRSGPRRSGSSSRQPSSARCASLLGDDEVDRFRVACFDERVQAHQSAPPRGGASRAAASAVEVHAGPGSRAGEAEAEACSLTLPQRVTCLSRAGSTFAGVRTLVVVVLVAVALAAAGVAAAYPWPLKPFDRQHAVRGNFGDPRTLRGTIDAVGRNPLSFHSGVDIQAPDGTPVYAVEGGEVVFNGRYAIAIGTPYAAASAPLVIGYWHVDRLVANFEYVAPQQLIGYVHPGAGHVHLSERLYGEFVNPLRAGGLTPYADTEPPVIRGLVVYRSGTDEQLPTNAVTGTVDLAVDAYDRPPITLRPPWNKALMSPVHITSGGLIEGAWFPLSLEEQPVDFTRLPSVPLDDVYAPGTRQNAPGIAGDYRFWLVRRLQTSLLGQGTKAIRVTATDIRENSTTARLEFTVAPLP